MSKSNAKNAPKTAERAKAAAAKAVATINKAAKAAAAEKAQNEADAKARDAAKAKVITDDMIERKLAEVRAANAPTKVDVDAILNEASALGHTKNLRVKALLSGGATVTKKRPTKVTVAGETISVDELEDWICAPHITPEEFEQLCSTYNAKSEREIVYAIDGLMSWPPIVAAARPKLITVHAKCIRGPFGLVDVVGKLTLDLRRVGWWALTFVPDTDDADGVEATLASATIPMPVGDTLPVGTKGKASLDGSLDTTSTFEFITI